MNKELEALQEVRQQLNYYKEYAKEKLPTKAEQIDASCEEELNLIETTLKYLQEENKLLRDNIEHLDETYFDTWYACERLKKNTNYALMFVDNTYCLVDTKDNKFNVIENYKITNKGIIDNETLEKLIALDIIVKKRVDIHNLIYSSNVEEYNNFAKNYNQELCDTLLTQEEYELLKEVLK